MFARTLPALVLLAAAASTAGGQPDGKKIIPGHRTVVLEKELPGYVFFTVTEKAGKQLPNEPPPLPEYRAAPVKIAPGVPKVVEDMLPLYVVPEADAKANPDPLVLGQKLANSLIPGAHSITYAGAAEVDESDPRTRNEIRVILKYIDPNAGLIYDRFSNDPDDPRQIDGPRKLPAEGGAGGPVGAEPEKRSRLPLIIGVILGVGALIGVGAWVVLARRNREDDDE